MTYEQDKAQGSVCYLCLHKAFITDPATGLIGPEIPVNMKSSNQKGKFNLSLLLSIIQTFE
jgi:hypothetical protein